MKSIFFDCCLGISGDMMACSLFDLGVPYSVFSDNLTSLKIDKIYNLGFENSNSNGIKGIVCKKNQIQSKELSRNLKDIKKIIMDSSLNNFIKEKVIRVYEILAEAESNVHGLKISDVHFHELGSLDSMIDIVNVCSAIDFLKPKRIYFSKPPTGTGIVSTSHGVLPVPVPTVLEIAKQNKISLIGFDDQYNGEITTPTGIALIAAFADKIGQPESISIDKIGIGLGTKNISRPNFLRVILLDMNDDNLEEKNINNSLNESIISQEAWIDDSTPEDIAILIERLRSAGAIDVICYPIDMKKNRKGICIKVILPPESSTSMREVWFNYSTTLGLRENKINRWILPRRTIKHMSTFGEISFKKAIRPNGQISIKIEHNDLSKISLKTGFPIEKIRQKIFKELSDFYEVNDSTH